MTIRGFIGLAAIGGLLYAHKRHGGQFNVNSIKQSGRDLIDATKDRTQDFRAKASTRVHEVADKVRAKVGEKREQGSNVIDDVTAGATEGYGYGDGHLQR